MVRRVLPGETGPSGGPALTDVLGICESWADGEVGVRRADGELVVFATASIVSGKPVPPRPSVHRRLDAATADRRAAAGWVPHEQEPLGDWVLRASAGFSSRANSVLALGDPGVPVAQAVAHVTRWYADRGLPPRAHVVADDERPDPAAAATLDALHAAGWTAYEQTHLMLASVAKVARRLPDAEPEGLVHAPSVDPGWLATDERTARFGEAATRVLEAGEVTLVTVRGPGGDVLARGRASVHDDWVGVSGLWTREDRRGEGLGTAVLASLLGWGAERGATTAYLQVVAANARARALYESHGFEVHHRYDYLER